MLRVVGLGEMIVSAQPADVLVTYSLGSCVGVALYDSEACVGGLIHCMLPLSTMDSGRARTEPCVFADSGVVEVLREMIRLGATRKNIKAVVGGGAAFRDNGNAFRIGERNLTIVRRVLWKNDILITRSEVGGAVARTMKLSMESGRTTILTGAGRTETNAV